jgi:hypothetical protein
MSGLDMALGDSISSRKKDAPTTRAKPAAKGATGGKGSGKGGKGSGESARIILHERRRKIRTHLAPIILMIVN